MLVFLQIMLTVMVSSPPLIGFLPTEKLGNMDKRSHYRLKGQNVTWPLPSGIELKLRHHSCAFEAALPLLLYITGYHEANTASVSENLWETPPTTTGVHWIYWTSISNGKTEGKQKKWMRYGIFCQKTHLIRGDQRRWEKSQLSQSCHLSLFSERIDQWLLKDGTVG